MTFKYEGEINFVYSQINKSWRSSLPLDLNCPARNGDRVLQVEMKEHWTLTQSYMKKKISSQDTYMETIKAGPVVLDA